MKTFLPSLAILFLIQLTSTAAIGRDLINLQRQDSKTVSAMVYKPIASECKGVAIISHGAGGSEKGYTYLGTAMSSFGYLAVVVGHQESGFQAVQELIGGKTLSDGLAKLITDPKAYQARFMDIAVAKDWAQGQCNSKVAVLIGHSMGAATVMMQAGALNKLNIAEVPKFTAYIAISPQGSGLIFPENAWNDINQPVLMLTGTQDKELGGLSWQTRTEPFNNMKSGCKWLGVIDGATHMNFAGRGISKKTETLTSQVIREFLTGVQASDCKLLNQISGMTISVK
jgi:predicted dienelactone hydrolase